MEAVRPEPKIEIMPLGQFLGEITEIENRPWTLIQTTSSLGKGERSRQVFGEMLSTSSNLRYVIPGASARPVVREYVEESKTNIKELSGRPQTGSGVYGGLIGINHIRSFMVGANDGPERVYLYTLDPVNEGALSRSELVIRINDPEMAQQAKIFALWDFERGEKCLTQKFDETTMTFDTGRTNTGFVSKRAIDILREAPKGSEIITASSWYPDNLLRGLQEHANSGSKIDLLVNDPLEYENIPYLVFNISKLISAGLNRIYRLKNCNTYNPLNESIHARFLLVRHVNGFARWIVTSSNMTRMGDLLQPSEFSIDGRDPDVAKQLADFYHSIPTRPARI